MVVKCIALCIVVRELHPTMSSCICGPTYDLYDENWCIAGARDASDSHPAQARESDSEDESAAVLLIYLN